jgi:hypothetical protein
MILGLLRNFVSIVHLILPPNQNFHDPRTIPSERKVCLGGGGWFEGKFRTKLNKRNPGLPDCCSKWDYVCFPQKLIFFSEAVHKP